MLTWQADDGRGFEGTRLLLGSGGFRAMGRMVRVAAEGGFTSSYRLIVDEDGTMQRVSLTSATAQRERHLTLNRTEDGFWLVDTGSGASRASFDGAVDVDLAHSAMFNTLPIRRLALHRGIGDDTLKMVFVTLPELQVQLVEQRYRTVSTLDDDGSAVVTFSWGKFSADLVVDADGVVMTYPGVAKQQPAHQAASTAG
ncbi:MAG: putative glycolipid-binding domain-containing protein [Pseudonocardia sp.]